MRPTNLLFAIFVALFNRSIDFLMVPDRAFLFQLFFAGLITSLLGSCMNSKELIYFNDIQDLEQIAVANDSSATYKLKPGDILYVGVKSLDPEVNVLFNPEEGGAQSGTTYQKYTTPDGAYVYGYEVKVDGMLELPILGKIAVEGIDMVAAEAEIQKQADLFLKMATVKVKLLNYKITVLGEVESPGVYYNYNNTFTVLDALGLANGNGDYANISNVTVLRTTPDGKKAYKLNLRQKSAFLSAGYHLQPDDFLFVEPHKHKNIQLNSQSIYIFFSSMSMAIAVWALVDN
jgi:polysaccharide biosynthesis/export protein